MNLALRPIAVAALAYAALAASAQPQPRPVTDFTEVSLSAPIDVHVALGDTHALTLEGDAEMLARIETLNPRLHAFFHVDADGGHACELADGEIRVAGGGELLHPLGIHVERADGGVLRIRPLFGLADLVGERGIALSRRERPLSAARLPHRRPAPLLAALNCRAP